MSRASIHDKLGRVRPPRVHIKYEVHTDGAVEEKELPFVVGVLGDFSGNPSAKPKDLKDRKFIQIDRDNFNEIMAQMAPELNLRVENTLAPKGEDGKGSELAVQLKFSKLEDFEPGRLVQQVGPLRELLEVRNKLRDLLVQVDRSDLLEGQLEELLQHPEKLAQLGAGRKGDAGAAGDKEKAPEKGGEE